MPRQRRPVPGAVNLALAAAGVGEVYGNWTGDDDLLALGSLSATVQALDHDETASVAFGRTWARLRRHQRPSHKLVPKIMSKWYHFDVATNLRLDERAASALRDAAQRTGRSQQELLREAIDRYLGLIATESSRDRAVASGVVRSPSPFVDVDPTIRLADGLTSLDLLDRDDQR